MKKTNGASTQKKKARARQGKRPGDMILDVFQSMGEEEFAMLRNVMLSELGIDSETLAPNDPVDLFREYLADPVHRTGDDNPEFLEQLVVELSNVRVDANGGDRRARDKVEAIYDLLDHAVEIRSLPAWDIILTGKILVDAGWAVPDRLKQAMTSAMREPPPLTQDDAERNVVSALADLAEQAGQNPFDMYEHVSSFLATFPPDAGAAFLSTLAASGKPAIYQAVAGFILNQDAAQAQAATEALVEAARQKPVETSQVDRLVRMRPWLPPERQGGLDHAIRAMRLNALPPVHAQQPAILKCYLSVCDGTGTRSLFATQRTGAQYQIATVMMKVVGVAEALILPDLPKSRMDRIVREMKSSMPIAETDLAGIARTLELALGDNSASQTLPPFKLVEVVETLGLGQLHPDSATPMDICARLLFDLPPEQTDARAVARANARVLDSGFEYQWFEAGEALDDLLYPVKGSRQRVIKMMNAWLPERRHFWARQCALSALAMRSDGKTRDATWKQLALVGREIASDVPLERIPLMKQIAEVSVEVFESGM
jgi:hypothetical protein